MSYITTGENKKIWNNMIHSNFRYYNQIVLSINPDHFLPLLFSFPRKWSQIMYLPPSICLCFNPVSRECVTQSVIKRSLSSLIPAQESTAASYCSSYKVGILPPASYHMLLLLLLSRFSRVRLRATPQTEAHQAPPSLGFSRQEHWSGLPFPSPMHESEK